MKKIHLTQNFNIGKYIDCIYRFWNRSINRSVFVNRLLRVFLRRKMADYELDKASVSKLRSHTYDLAKSVKKAINAADDSIATEFASIIQGSVTCPLDVLAFAIHDALSQSEEATSDSVKRLGNDYCEGNYEMYLFRSFKHAAVMPNQPFLPKARTGRKPRGSFDSVFYLSEEEKTFERIRLTTKIMKSKDRLTKQDFKEMIELMAYAFLVFTQDEKKIVAERFLQRWKNDDEGISAGAEFLGCMEGARMTFGEKKAHRFLNWEKAVAEAEASLVISAFSAAYRKAVRQNSFADVRRILNGLVHNEAVVKSDALKTSLADNGFFLPDFSGHITHSLWSYCLDIARLSKQVGLVNGFCDVLNGVYLGSSRNGTVGERIEALRKTAKDL